MKSLTLSFQLPDADVQTWEGDLPDPWEHNPFGHLIFLSKYSRVKRDGTKETWTDVVRRCVEGVYSIQKDWCFSQSIPWDEAKAHRSAAEMFRLIYTFKFTPPGRGLWMMGTEFVHDRMGAAALQNCAFVSSRREQGATEADSFLDAAAFLMEASMLGVGVGFDTLASGRVPMVSPSDLGTGEVEYVVPDTREGWVASTVALLRHFLEADVPMPRFDYSQIRPEGEPIKGFGGTAAGPKPLKRLHTSLEEAYWSLIERVVPEWEWMDESKHRDQWDESLYRVDERFVVDVMNMIGCCVVAGNVRRSAEIALGDPDSDFRYLKDIVSETGEALHPIAEGRSGHYWASNNSIVLTNHHTSNGFDYDSLLTSIERNGEPGIVWLDVSRDYGRLSDPPNGKDRRALGTNPCGEQTLESYEMCNLVETYPSNHGSEEEFSRTLKFAYLYAKSVTLLPTHWERTNAIMLRNRRIGTSMTGVFQFAEEHGLPRLRRWMEHGYDTIQHYDEIYSEWLCIRESIKTTSIKPSGTVSKVVTSTFRGDRYAGISAGVHAPVARRWIQHVTFGANDPVLDALYRAGYDIEPSHQQEGSFVARIPVQGPPIRTQDEVTVWEKAALAAEVQAMWADNSVSVTLDFNPDEAPHIPRLLHAFEGQFKAVSFLNRGDGTKPPYRQMPMDRWVPLEEIEAYEATLSEVDLAPVYEGGDDALDAQGERFCDSDICQMPETEGLAVEQSPSYVKV